MEACLGPEVNASQTARLLTWGPEASGGQRTAQRRVKDKHTHTHTHWKLQQMCTPFFQGCGDLWHAHRANKSLLRPATEGGREGGRESEIDGNTERPERQRDWRKERKKERDVACLPRRGQESSITARSRHSLSSLFFLFYSVAVFFFVCVCFQFSQGLLLLLYSLQPWTPTPTPTPPSKPPTKKERERLSMVFSFQSEQYHCPRARPAFSVSGAQSYTKGPVLWQPIVGMTQRSSQNSRHCHPPLRDPWKQKCWEFERLGKERSCVGGQGHILLYTISYTEILSDL